MKNLKLFFKNWWIVGVIVTAFSVWYVLTNRSDALVQDLFDGLFVEVLGALATLVLIDRVFKINEERKRVRIEKAALKGFKFTIQDMLNVFWSMRRSGARKPLDTPPRDWREAIGIDEAIDDIRHLDFLSDAGIHPPMKWCNYVASSFEQKHLPAIRRVIDSYALYLSPELVEGLEALNGDAVFSRLFLQGNGFSSLPASLPQAIPALATVGLQLKEAINKLLRILDSYNELCPDTPIEFMGMDLSEKTKPLVGTGRCEFTEVGNNIIAQPSSVVQES